MVADPALADAQLIAEAVSALPWLLDLAASAIEARRAETAGLGAEHESAVAASETP